MLEAKFAQSTMINELRQDISHSTA